MRTAACPFRSLAEVKRANADRGHAWFSSATMSFFDSQLHGPLYPRETVDENVAVVAADGTINPGAVEPSPREGYSDEAHAYGCVALLLMSEQQQ